MPELDRRQFLKVVGMGAGAAATAGYQEPVEKDIPPIRDDEGDGGLQKHGFPRAGWPEEREHLPRLDGQIHAGQHRRVEGLVDVAVLDHRVPYCSIKGGNMASRMRMVRVMNMTAWVVVRPTPSAPPLVLKPMWTEMSGITSPNTSDFEKE